MYFIIIQDRHLCLEQVLMRSRRFKEKRGCLKVTFSLGKQRKLGKDASSAILIQNVIEQLAGMYRKELNQTHIK